MKQETQIFDLIAEERARQMKGIELIASENFVSDQVMQAMGSVLTNKYAEGYPAARYYGGCEVVDKVERLAIERLCKLYGAEYANVQPHSGAQANMAVFFAVLKPGDTFMGLDLAHGGHLSHGSPVNMSGTYFLRRWATVSTRPRARSTTTRWSSWLWSANPNSSWAALRPTRASGTTSACAKSPTRWGRCCWWTWRTRQV